MNVEIVRDKWFRCIHPDHEDNNPSCGPIPSGDGFHCFSCGFSGDTFTAAHVLENKPITGKDFLQDNVFYLANKLGIPYDQGALITDEMKEKYSWLQVFRATGDILQTDASDRQFAIKRGWTEKTCKVLGIGTISEKSIGTRLHRDIDINPKDLFKPAKGIFSILNAQLFGQSKLTFTLFDHRGNPIGFQSRNLNWEPPVKSESGETIKSNKAKYINSPESIIYKKRETLTGIHFAIKSERQDLYVFEGTGSWVTAWQAGLTNSATTCGTAITSDHINLIFQKNFRTIYLCVDTDDAGKKSIINLIKRVPTLLAILNSYIIEIPKGENYGENDADWYIQVHGVKAFKKLPKINLFQWLLDNVSHDNDNKEEFVMEMIDIIASDPNPISWNVKINMLAEHTGIASGLIMMQVQKVSEGIQQEIKHKEITILERLRNDLRRSDTPIPLLEMAITDLHGVGSRRIIEDSTETCLEWTEGIAKEFLSQTDNSDRWITEWALWDSVLEGGIPKEDSLLVLGGLPQQGKSAFLINLICQICSLPENDDLLLYFLTIDDSWKQVLPKMISCWLGSEINIREARYPKRIQSKDKFNAWQEAYNEIKRWIEIGRLKITDHTHSDSLGYAVQQVRHLQQQYPNKKILFFLDNFHKINVDGLSEREKYKKASETLHKISTKDKISIVTTAELNKSAYGDNLWPRRPQEKDLSETGKLAYDCQFIGLAYTELESKKDHPDKASHYWEMPTQSGIQKMPVFELNISKNKISSIKRKLVWEFTPDACIMEEVELHRVYHGK